jgi:hypothetical protein
MVKRPRVQRRAEVTTKPCGCCGLQAILTLTTVPEASAPSTTGGPVTLCAECIIALAQALAQQR